MLNLTHWLISTQPGTRVGVVVAQRRPAARAGVLRRSVPTLRDAALPQIHVAEDDARIFLVMLHGRTPSRSLLDSSASALRRDEPHHGRLARGQRALDEVVEVGSGERGGALG